MSVLQVKTDERVTEKYKNYPDPFKDKLAHLRELILEVAQEHEQITQIEETLKWGEPSFITKKGSTLRMDWKEKTPNQYAMSFKCTSLLVSTFKEVYPTLFTYEGTRAIVFQLEDDIPKAELKNCIRAALTYHSVKQLPLLGMEI